MSDWRPATQGQHLNRNKTRPGSTLRALSKLNVKDRWQHRITNDNIITRTETDRQIMQHIVEETQQLFSYTHRMRKDMLAVLFPTIKITSYRSTTNDA